MGVYSYSGLGKMYGVWGLYNRLSCQLFWDVRRQELASSVILLHQLWHLQRGLPGRCHNYQHWLGWLTTVSVLDPYNLHYYFSVSWSIIKIYKHNLLLPCSKREIAFNSFTLYILSESISLQPDSPEYPDISRIATVTQLSHCKRSDTPYKELSFK